MSGNDYDDLHALGLEDLYEERDKCLEMIQAAIVKGESPDMRSTDRYVSDVRWSLNEIQKIINERQRQQKREESQWLAEPFDLAPFEKQFVKAFFGISLFVMTAMYFIAPVTIRSPFDLLFGSSESTEMTTADHVAHTGLLVLLAVYVAYIDIWGRQRTIETLVRFSQTTIENVAEGMEDQSIVTRAKRLTRNEFRRLWLVTAFLQMILTVGRVIWSLMAMRVYMYVYRQSCGDVELARQSATKVYLASAKVLMFYGAPGWVLYLTARYVTPFMF